MYYHHERNDGSGYPEGLKKDEIPTFAKIIGLAETFAALIANRPYREKVDYAQALAIIRDSRSKFDREIIEALTKVVQSSGGYR
jgi:HD-GYP domain-containing protein (c-di-GMP phosphodiesterase class II)